MENITIELFNQEDNISSPTVDKPPLIPKLKDRLTEELVIALVGPVGSGCTISGTTIKRLLSNDYNYEVHYYKLSEYISADKSSSTESLTGAERIKHLQDAGDKLRKRYGYDYLSAKVIEDIANKRDKAGLGQTAEGINVTKKLRHVHIIDSVKHPEELLLLKNTYGEILWTVGVFAPYDVRLQRLSIHGHIEPNQINDIVQKDYSEDEDYGQKVSDVFHLSDFFIRNDRDNTSQLERSINRFLEVLFGSPVHTPTLDESSMYAAYAEAAKSACLSRSVGASIVSDKGELIGLGRNDVPKYKGGLYIEDDLENDHRCHAWQGKECHNDKKKNGLYEQIYSKLKAAKLLSGKASIKSVEKELKNTDVKSLIEYSRAVHAEMDAITSIARTSKVGVMNGTLYSTTFPCHSCARHIVASGITTVFFIEPYPKSLAIELHSDAVSEKESDEGKKVLFLQYTGIAPKNILKLFSSGARRKDKNGKVNSFNKKEASPVVMVSLDDYATHEKWVIAELEENEKQGKDGQ
jgi:deoxycytidylate deaminase